MLSLRSGLYAASIATLAASLAACGGSSTSVTPSAVLTPQATTTPAAAAAAPTPIAGTAALQPSFTLAATQPVAAPAPGASAAIGLPSTGSAAVGGSITVAVPAGQSLPAGTAVASLAAPAGSATLPGGVPQIAAFARSPRSIGGVAVTPVYDIGLQFTSFSGSFTIAIPSITVTIPALPAGAGVALALFDPGKPQLGWEQNFAFGTGAVSVNGTSATFTPSSPTITVYPNSVYWLAIYVYPLTIAAPPTAAPSVAPSAPATTPSPVPPTGTMPPATASPNPLVSSSPAPGPSSSPAPGTSSSPAPSGSPSANPSSSPGAAATALPGSVALTVSPQATTLILPTSSPLPNVAVAGLSYGSSSGGSVNVVPVSSGPPSFSSAFTPPSGGTIVGYTAIQNPSSAPLTITAPSLGFQVTSAIPQFLTSGGSAGFLALNVNGAGWFGGIAAGGMSGDTSQYLFQPGSLTLPAGTTVVIAAYVVPSGLSFSQQINPGASFLYATFSDPTGAYNAYLGTPVNLGNAGSSVAFLRAGVGADPTPLGLPAYTGTYPAGATGRVAAYGGILFVAPPSVTISANGNGGNIELQVRIPNASSLASTYYLAGFDGPATGGYASTLVSSSSVFNNYVHFTTTAGRLFAPNGTYGFAILY